MRGSGKTALLRQKFPKALYRDLLDDEIYQSYLTHPNQFYEEVKNHKKGSLVIVDEVQRLPVLLNSVHRLIESGSFQFILTGSSARRIRARGVNLLAGRAGWLTLHPFVPEELGGDFHLSQALQFGLLPVVWSASDRAFALKAYTQMYLREEIKAEALVRNLPGFARFLPVAGLYHGQVVNMSSIARESHISRDCVRSFFSILEDTMLGFFLPAWSKKIRLRQTKHPKFYFIDPGLARALKHESDYPLPSADRGFLFEGLVAQILRVYKEYRNLCESISYWQPAGSGKVEVDFLLQRGHKELIAIEVKSGDSIFPGDYKGLQALENLPEVKRRIIIYPGRRNRLTRKGIEIWTFSHFLKMLQTGQL